MRTNYQRGYEAEARARRELQAAGYYVMRSSASKGVFDLIAVGHGEVILLQLKRTKRRPGPSAYRDDLAQMRECVEGLELPPNCKVELWVWVDFQGWTKVDALSA